MSPQQGTVADRILKAVRLAPGCQLDDLERSCPDLNWNQVFLEIDHFSRTGQVRLTAKGLGVYTVRLPTDEAFTLSPNTKRGKSDEKRAGHMARSGPDTTERGAHV
jgi:hypothetical protein